MSPVLYRPAEICPFDLWEPRTEIPVGHGQTRKGWVVVACLGYSRAGAGALLFSKQTSDLLAGIRRCLWSLGALSKTLFGIASLSCTPATAGRPTDKFAAFCGALRVDWYFCDPRDPQAKGVVERMQDFMERSFEPDRARLAQLGRTTTTSRSDGAPPLGRRRHPRAGRASASNARDGTVALVGSHRCSGSSRR